MKQLVLSAIKSLSLIKRRLTIQMTDLTDKQRDELIKQYVELIIDNMDIKTMTQVITEQLTDTYQDYSIEELQTQVETTHDKELYKELVENVTNPTVLDLNYTGGKF